MGSEMCIRDSGDTVKVKILDVDFDKKRVSLSRKALLDAPVADEAPAEEEKTEE